MRDPFSSAEYRSTVCDTADLWPGGGFHFAFLVHNRPGESMAPVLGELRVLIGSRPYNVVTNATSSKPLAPCVIIREVDDLFQTNYGRSVRHRSSLRPTTVSVVLEAFIRGGPIPRAAPIVVELEQGSIDAHQLRFRSSHVSYSWFRFAIPPVN